MSLKYAISLLSTLCLLSGCGNDGVWANAKDLLVETMNPVEKKVGVNREKIEEIPYASISAQLEDTVPGLMILGYVDGDILQWIDANNISISTRFGRIVKTVGFESDISYLRVTGNDWLVNPKDFSYPYDFNMTLEAKGATLTSESLSCTVKQVGNETITIVEILHDTIHYIEKCESSLGWNATSDYWLDMQNDLVWRSRQGFLSGKYHITINILKNFS